MAGVAKQTCCRWRYEQGGREVPSGGENQSICREQRLLKRLHCGGRIEKAFLKENGLTKLGIALCKGRSIQACGLGCPQPIGDQLAGLDVTVQQFVDSHDHDDSVTTGRLHGGECVSMAAGPITTRTKRLCRQRDGHDAKGTSTNSKADLPAIRSPPIRACSCQLPFVRPNSSHSRISFGLR